MRCKQTMVVNFAALAASDVIPGMTTTVSSFDPTLVALSFVISAFGSLTGLQSARRARSGSGRTRIAWLAAAALSIGGGAIWSMHFIGMLAYQNQVSYSLDMTRTMLSLVVAIAGSGVALYVVARAEPTVAHYLGAGLVAGLGIAGMHYLGLSAMRMNADLTYRPTLVGVSVGVAVVTASVAFVFAFALRRAWATVAAAIVLGAGICAAHYTAMFALVMTPPAELSASPVSGVNPLSLALPVFGIASVLLFVLLFVGLFEGTESSPGARAVSRADDRGRLRPANDLGVLEPR